MYCIIAFGKLEEDGNVVDTNREGCASRGCRKEKAKHGSALEKVDWEQSLCWRGSNAVDRLYSVGDNKSAGQAP